MKTDIPNKKHADFQDPYRRSSNFRRVIPKREFELSDDGKLKLQKEEND